MLGRNSCSWPKRRKGEMKGGKEGHLRVGGDFEDGRKGTLKEGRNEGKKEGRKLRGMKERK